MKENIIVLDELNKGCMYGMNSINVIMDKSIEKKFFKVLKKLYNKYKKIHKRIEIKYKKYSNKEPDSINPFEKVMNKSIIDIKTITDNSTSYLSDLLLQGTNMGIIEGRKIFNHKVNIDKDIKRLVNDFISMQEEEIEILKMYL